MNLGDVIDCCLNIHFNYLENLQRTIKEILNKVADYNNKNICLPLKIFENYLGEIFGLYKIQDKNINNNIIKDTLDFPRIKMLLLIVELSKKQLISWNCLDILYQNTNLFKTIITLHENENLENLGAFFEEVIANLEYIKDIINLFPYSLFENSNFSLINEILYIIVKNTSEKR